MSSFRVCVCLAVCSATSFRSYQPLLIGHTEYRYKKMLLGLGQKQDSFLLAQILPLPQKHRGKNYSRLKCSATLTTMHDKYDAESRAV